MKKVLGVLAVLGMIILCGAAWAELSGEFGEDMKWVLDDDGVLTVSGTGEMTDRPWYLWKNSVKSVIIEEGVTTIYECAFQDCRQLTSVVLPESITHIDEWAFRDCGKLTSLMIPANVTHIGEYAFAFCPALTEIIIPKSITSISFGLFQGCTSLTSLTLHENITSIGESAFADCRNLTEIVIPDGITTLESNTFAGCTSMTSVTLPESLVEIKDNAFNGCSSLTNVYYKGTDSQWNEISMGTGNENLTDILHYNYFGGTCGENVTWVLDEDGILKISGFGPMEENENITPPWYERNSTIKSVVVEDGVTSISVSAFENCRQMTSVELPPSITQIGKYAFYDCESLTSLEIPSGVTEIGELAFFCCTGLTEMTVPKGVTSISMGLFERCTGLTSFTLHEDITSIGEYAFEGCSNLLKIDLPDAITAIENNVFNGCANLVSMIIPDSVTSIGKNAFEGCTSLKSVAIPESVTSIGEKAFTGCASITVVAIPENVTSIDKGVFADCTGLTSVVIPENVTGIGGNAFSGCANLMSVDLPESMIVIGESAFVDCGMLSKVTYHGTKEMWSAILILSGNEKLKDAEITFLKEPEMLPAPENVHWKEGSVATAAWDAVEGAAYYQVTVYAYYYDEEEGEEEAGTAGTETDNCEIDLRQEINRIIANYYQYKDVYVRFGVCGAYYDVGMEAVPGEKSELSDPLLYRKVAEAITLSPRKSVLFKEHSMQLGAEIEPEDAYYTEITWSSSDSSIVSVDDTGYISGIKAGSAKIEAAIGNVADAIDVYVYTIATNIEDESAQQEVTEIAGTIIENVCNQNSLDISNMDIDPENIQGIHDQMLAGIERGDEFHIDMRWDDHDWADYALWQEKIMSLMPDGHFAAGYEVYFEMYHTEAEESISCHIGNITEIENEISFELELPELPVAQRNNRREYSLIRICDGEAEKMPATIGDDGKLPGKTNRPADFVLMYEDIPVMTLPADLTVIEREAFAGISAVEIIIPEGCVSIGSRAFADCENLKYVSIPASVETIAEDAFEGSNHVVFDYGK